MNSIIVTRACRIEQSGILARNFSVGEIIQPNSPYFRHLLWAGYATDSGIPALPTNVESTSLEPARFIGTAANKHILVFDTAVGTFRSKSFTDVLTADPAFQAGSGGSGGGSPVVEDTSDPGFFIIPTGSSLVEDPSDPGTFLIG